MSLEMRMIQAMRGRRPVVTVFEIMTYTWSVLSLSWVGTISQTLRYLEYCKETGSQSSHPLSLTALIRRNFGMLETEEKTAEGRM